MTKSEASLTCVPTASPATYGFSIDKNNYSTESRYLSRLRPYASDGQPIPKSHDVLFSVRNVHI
ncbi:hypothetical protein CY34DRAFT_802307 [Suillus luteus UH-Slu-Lm8-n1]|uniref:Uncharacterized protein n=1 Tax=Suillus luteus UH-Slu-Lm8-n1 TaxID=930992 RepID=A0A0D0BNS4_9AGAM|nr:hypothetical protein CY34DRAFT_802307 [Suillus luteus UH-Slu-Lm8-n1]